jgi:hypothetical protein
MSYDDEDDYPRPRRSRRGRKHGSNVGMWVALAGLVLVFLVGGLVAVVVSRKGGRDGTSGHNDVARVLPGGPGITAITPGNRRITLEEFNGINKDDTLATLEARFGPAQRWGPADLEKVDFSFQYPRLRRNGDVGFSFARYLREAWHITNPECYYWSGGDTQVFVIPIRGHPTANLQRKYYCDLGRDEHGMARHTHSSASLLPP